MHLYKIKSHTGVIGNEMADDGAKRALKKVGTVSIRDNVSTGQEGYWAQESAKQGATAQRNEQEAAKARQLSNLTDDLKAACHRKHRLGAASTDKIYYSMWRALRAQSQDETNRAGLQALQDVSNYFWQSLQLKTKEVRMLLQARSGGLYTQKLACRYGYSDTDTCLLCGQPDGAMHALSG